MRILIKSPLTHLHIKYENLYELIVRAWPWRMWNLVRVKVKWRQHKINIFLYFFTILTVCFGLKQIYFTDQLDCFTKHFHLKLYLKWIILTISWVFCTGWIVLKPVVNIVFCQCLHRFIFAGPYWIILECPEGWTSLHLQKKLF